MRKCYCRVNFHNLGISKLELFINGVRNGVYNNAADFISPPDTAPVFDAIALDYFTSAAEYQQFGITKQTAFLAARSTLMTHLDSLATYVNTIAVGDVSIIALAGFTPSKVHSQRLPAIEKIESFIVGVTRVSGDVQVEIPTINNRGAVTYSCICSEGAPLRSAAFIDGQMKFESDGTIYQDCTKSRKKTLHSLPPGSQCYFYVYATNSAGVSPLSDAKSVWVS